MSKWGLKKTQALDTTLIIKISNTLVIMYWVQMQMHDIYIIINHLKFVTTIQPNAPFSPDKNPVDLGDMYSTSKK